MSSASSESDPDTLDQVCNSIFEDDKKPVQQSTKSRIGGNQNGSRRSSDRKVRSSSDSENESRNERRENEGRRRDNSERSYRDRSYRERGRERIKDQDRYIDDHYRLGRDSDDDRSRRYNKRRDKYAERSFREERNYRDDRSPGRSDRIPRRGCQGRNSDSRYERNGSGVRSSDSGDSGFYRSESQRKSPQRESRRYENRNEPYQERNSRSERSFRKDNGYRNDNDSYRNDNGYINVNDSYRNDNGYRNVNDSYRNGNDYINGNYRYRNGNNSYRYDEDERRYTEKENNYDGRRSSKNGRNIRTDEDGDQYMESDSNGTLLLQPREMGNNHQSVTTIVLLGQTGSGKSTIGNEFLTGTEQRFLESDSTKSCTGVCKTINDRWRWNNMACKIIDTPGMDDSDGRDSEHIQDIVEYLKREVYVNAFVLVINGCHKRMGNSFKSMLRMFEIMFGKTFWDHVVIDVSHLQYDGRPYNQDKNQWVDAIRECYRHSRKSKLEIVYLDAHNTKNPEFRRNVEKLWMICDGMDDFECKDFEATKAEVDQLKDELIKKQAAIKETEEMHSKQLESMKQEAAGKDEIYSKRLETMRQEAEEKEESYRQMLDEEYQNKSLQIQKMAEEERKASQTKFVEEKENERKRFAEQFEEMKRKEAKEREDLKSKHDAKEKMKQKEIEEKEKHKNKLKEEKEEQEKKEMEIKKRSEEVQNDLLTKMREMELSFKAEIKTREESYLQRMREKDEMIANETKMFKEYVTAIRQDQSKHLEFIKQQTEVQAEQITCQFRELVEKSEKDKENIAAKMSEIQENQTKELGLIKKQGEEHAQIFQQEVKQIREKDRAELEQYKTKLSDLIAEGTKSEENFDKMYPALKAKKGGNSAWLNLQLEMPQQKGNTDRCRIVSKESKVVHNVKKGTVAARIVKVKHNRGMWGMMTGNPASNKPTKVILVVGMTGTGKSTLIDALMNYVFDVRYEDRTRLEIINLTKKECKKKANQATSQTDHITVYEIEWLAGMMIDYNLVLIDTPGLGDTRGIEYDHKMIDNIKVLFDSKEVTTLDSIAFVVKAGDARLTAQTKYTFERILQIFGNDVKDNLVALLTFYDGHDLKALDAFKEANVDFEADFPFNSASIFDKKTTEKVDKDILNTNPEVIQFQHFYKESKKFFLKVGAMQSRSLQLTKEVLKDRQHIEATITGLNIRVRDLLLVKDKVDQEKRICEQHEADAKANEDTEYEVEEQKGVCVNLEVGTYVTNCKNCNVTCHFPCAIPNDEDKRGCAAMDNEEEPSCTVCPKNCIWSVHVNNDFRYEIEIVMVRKTYEDIKQRHQEFLDKHKGQITIVQALEEESKELSDEIQNLVNIITDCLKRLTKNALRKCNTSSTDYLDQMISAEDQERKPGFQRRIEQLQIEKAKAETLEKIMSGHGVY